MTEAKYHVGQLVAVFSQTPQWGLLVIPATRVVGVAHVQKGRLYTSRYGMNYIPEYGGWIYEVTVGPHAYRESSLRPIDKDEYTDSDLSTQPQDKETSTQ